MIPGQEGQQLTTAMLAAATEEQQKQMLGERIFPKVHELQVRAIPPCWVASWAHGATRHACTHQLCCPQLLARTKWCVTIQGLHVC